MSGAVTIYSPKIEQLERTLVPYIPKFAELLPPAYRPQHMIAAACAQLMNNAYAADIAAQNPVSVAMSIMTGCVLALEIDGVTGQGYLIPFGGKDPKITFMPGYQGYITLADRGAFALDAYPIYSSDEFAETPSDTMKPIHHEVRYVQKSKRGEIIGYYALAKHATQPPRHLVLDMDDILVIRNKSASYKAKGNASIWALDFPAMCKKTPLRLLGKKMPLRTVQLAAGLDDLNEMGRPTYLRNDRQAVIEGTVIGADDLPALTSSGDWEAPAPLKLVTPDGKEELGKIPHLWASRLLMYVGRVSTDQLQTLVHLNDEHIKAAEAAGHVVQARAVRDAIKARQGQIAKEV